MIYMFSNIYICMYFLCAMLLDLEPLKINLPIDETAIGSVLGKSGSTIRMLEETHAVHIEISRVSYVCIHTNTFICTICIIHTRFHI